MVAAIFSSAAEEGVGLPMRGAMGAFTIASSPHIGHAISPDACWASKVAPSLNHASKPWLLAHRRLNEIMLYTLLPTGPKA